MQEPGVNEMLRQVVNIAGNTKKNSHSKLFSDL